MSGTFLTDVDRWVRKVAGSEGEFDKAVRKITFAVYYNIVSPSPFDTGRFLGNWQIGLGSRPQGVLDRKFSNPNSAVAEGMSKIGLIKAGGVTFIVNNLPYALALEFGHSQQAPQGMVRVAFSKIDQIVKGAVS